MPVHKFHAYFLDVNLTKEAWVKMLLHGSDIYITLRIYGEVGK